MTLHSSSAPSRAKHQLRFDLRNGLPYIFVIFFSLAVQLWGIFYWQTNFDSDEATFALMARHALQGSFTVYMYGQSYLASFESLVAAALIWAFGSSVVVFRLSTLLIFGLFLALQSIFLYRLWGRTIAIWSLLLLAIPGRLIYIWLYRPITGLQTVFMLGTGLLLIATMRSSKTVAWSYVPIAIGGVLTGLGLWAHPQFVVYIATFCCITLLLLPEWKRARAQFDAFFRRSGRSATAITVGTISFAILGILGFFTSGCEPQRMFDTIQMIGRLLMVGLVALIGFTILRVSNRHVELVGKCAVFGGGVVIGNLPQWGGWLFANVPPTTAITASCPTSIGARIDLVGGQLIPALWGMPALSSFADRGWSGMIWLGVAMVVVIALAYFLWAGRSAWRALITLSPPRQDDWGFLIVGLLLGIPVVLVVLGGNAIDELSARYLLVAWTVSSVPLAYFLSRVFSRAIVAAPVIMLWLAWIGAANMQELHQIWQHSGPHFDPRSVAMLRSYLHDHDIDAGYADYWISYPVDFLTHEDIRLVPYNGIDRYQPYTGEVKGLSTLAYVVYSGLIPETDSNIDALINELSLSRFGRGTFPHAMPQADRQTVIDRTQIGTWDVWIVGPSS